MDLNAAKDLNRGALLRVLGMLCAMVGLVGGAAVATLPRHLRLNVLRRLRPLESALRRLVVMYAAELEADPPVERGVSGADKKAVRKTGAGTRNPSFPLVERSPRTGSPARQSAAGAGPRMYCFDEFDVPPETAAPDSSPDDAMDAGALCRRLAAAQAVLADLPKFAMRLAQWQARKRRIFEKKGRLAAGRMCPLRAGLPPGHRARGRYEIDEILAECHLWALRTIEAPDTS